MKTNYHTMTQVINNMTGHRTIVGHLEALVHRSGGAVAYRLPSDRPYRVARGLAEDEPPRDLQRDGLGVHDISEDESYYEKAMEAYNG